MINGDETTRSIKLEAARATRSRVSQARDIFVAVADDSSFTGRQTERIVREAGFEILHTVLRHLALSSAVLGKLDMECGFVLIEVKLGNMGVFVYFENNIAYSRHLAISDPHLVAGKLADVFLSVRHHVYKSGLDGILAASAVITGGLANSPGSLSLAKDILEMPARRGRPRAVSGLTANWRSPAFAGIVGMAPSRRAFENDVS